MRLPSARLRAISPIIAMIVIISITLAIAFAVVGWLFGLWGAIAGGAPQISITNAKVNVTGAIELYIVNKGSVSDKILKVELIRGDQIATATYKSHGVGLTTTTGDGNTLVVVPANARGWVTYAIDKNKLSLSVGDSVIVKVYMENSGVYSIPVVVSP